MTLTFDASWLARRTEDPLEPEAPIIDPHHHLWAGRLEVTDYMVDDLDRDTSSGHNVVATVFVECGHGYRQDGPDHLRPVGETEAILAAVEQRTGAEGAEIRGIVGFADLTLGDAVEEVLEAHVAAADGRFRGIRHATAYQPGRRVGAVHARPTAGLMSDRRFRRGVARLAVAGLTFDAWIFHHQIHELTDLARAVPDVTFILDHLGGLIGYGPDEGARAEILACWRQDVAELARCENVVVKIGGIGMAIYGMGYEARSRPPSSDDLVADWGAPVAHVIELFGSDRCMFESNFPVDKASVSYVTLWNAFKKMAAGATAAEEAALLSGTAARVYEL